MSFAVPAGKKRQDESEEVCSRDQETKGASGK